MENILRINQIQEGNKKLIEVKIQKIPIVSKAIILYAGILTAIFIAIFLFFLTAIPLFFKIGIPIMLLIIVFFMFATASQIKYTALVLLKQGNNLYIRKVFSKNKVFEKTINLSSPKLVLVNFPISLGYYQLLLRNGNNLEILIPVEWDVVGKFPLIHPRMKKFLYTSENAKQLSKLLEIPLEESREHFNQYLTNFKK